MRRDEGSEGKEIGGGDEREKREEGEMIKREGEEKGREKESVDEVERRNARGEKIRGRGC